MKFTVKTFQTEKSLGTIFQDARKAINVTLQHVSQQLHISPSYLQALEESQYDKLPGDVYMELFVKSYSNYLDLDSGAMLLRLRKERKIFQNATMEQKVDVTQPIEKASKMHFLVTPKLAKGFLIVLIAGLCLTYIGIKVEAIVKSPELTILSPRDNILTEESIIVVSGRTEPEVILRINEQKVLVDDDGNFTEKLDLHTGLNVITFSAKKDYGNESVVLRHVVVEKKSSAP